jgi:tetraacyldisaccharide 4'-kinase
MAARAYGAAWEARRNAYAQGWSLPHRVPARVVSVGNLGAGGAGKTTLTLWLARRALDRNLDCAVVCLRYRPGPGGHGDEELLAVNAIGAARVFAGRQKWRLASAAAERHRLVLVDDGFSHWKLARDADLVLVETADPWSGGDLLPLGRLREPRRALQRADAVILTRARDVESARSAERAIRPYAPAARFAAARHRPAGVRGLGGEPREASGPAVLVAAIGNPEAARASALEAGFAPVRLASYRDHHWFTPAEAARELAGARAESATLLLTAKDAVRWPLPDSRVAVLEVSWEWLWGEREVWDLVTGAADAATAPGGVEAAARAVGPARGEDA